MIVALDAVHIFSIVLLFFKVSHWKLPAWQRIQDTDRTGYASEQHWQDQVNTGNYPIPPLSRRWGTLVDVIIQVVGPQWSLSMLLSESLDLPTHQKKGEIYTYH